MAHTAAELTPLFEISKIGFPSENGCISLSPNDGSSRADGFITICLMEWRGDHRENRIIYTRNTFLEQNNEQVFNWGHDKGERNKRTL